MTAYDQKIYPFDHDDYATGMFPFLHALTPGAHRADDIIKIAYKVHGTVQGKQLYPDP